MPGAPPAPVVTRPAFGRWVFLLVPLLVLPVPFLVNRYIQYVLNLILVYVLVGVGFNIVIGNLGQLAFANVALFGLGAYASGHPRRPRGLAVVDHRPPARAWSAPSPAPWPACPPSAGSGSSTWPS